MLFKITSRKNHKCCRRGEEREREKGEGERGEAERERERERWGIEEEKMQKQ